MTLQALPSLPTDGLLDIKSSNASQSRGAHGAFRYFGKLAPDVTGAVLDMAAERRMKTGAIRVYDPMCGSGTTLIEAASRGWEAFGTDVNPVAILYSKVKTRSVDRDRAYNMLSQVVSRIGTEDLELSAVFGQTQNSSRWFSQEAQLAIASIRKNVLGFPESRERDLLFAVLLSRLRRISNASERTGRIFFDPASAVPAVRDFEKAARSVIAEAPANDLPVHIQEADARLSPLKDASADIALVHPPYFALYRYSSDVLRFEMEVGGFSRRETARAEIREGWKSGDPSNLIGYAADMGQVLAETARVVGASGIVAMIASNSTLGDKALPVIDTVCDAATAHGLKVVGHVERKMRHGSASYHKSARSDKVISRDHIVFFKPSSSEPKQYLV